MYRPFNGRLHFAPPRLGTLRVGGSALVHGADRCVVPFSFGGGLYLRPLL